MTKAEYILHLVELGCPRERLAFEANTTYTYVRAVLSRRSIRIPSIKRDNVTGYNRNYELRASKETTAAFLKLLAEEAARCRA